MPTTHPATSRPPRATPRLDAGALALIVIGALCFARGFAGLARLRDGYMPSRALRTAVEQFGREELLSFAGLALIAAGLLLGVAATMITHRRQTAPSAS